VSGATRCIGCPKSKNVLSTQSYHPYGRVVFFDVPGNKLPGYHHFVPSGQQTATTCPHFRIHVTPLSELEDEDDYETLLPPPPSFLHRPRIQHKSLS